MSELYIGLISGTSLDGVDAALVDFAPHPPRLVQALCLPYTDDLLDEVKRTAAPRARAALDGLGRLDAKLGEHFARAAQALLEQAGIAAEQIRAVGSHGQTVAHEADGAHGFSMQLADPNRIAERTGMTTVADFRRRDVAAGGQGAPLTSGFHANVWRKLGENRAVLNLGGIANLTLLPGDGKQAVAGFDTGPANCLLDIWAQRHLQQAFDRGGRWAAGGQIDEGLLQKFLADPYFSRSLPKSTGTQYFSAPWLQERLKDIDVDPANVAATLTELTASSVTLGLRQAEFQPAAVIVCGGGALNGLLLARLTHRLPDSAVETSDAEGIEPEWVEAMAFAWLARETLAGRPGNLASVTGATGPRVLGAVYAGSGRAKGKDKRAKHPGTRVTGE